MTNIYELKDIHNEGRRAWINGAKASDNPYKDGTEEAEAWDNGFWDRD